MLRSNRATSINLRYIKSNAKSSLFCGASITCTNEIVFICSRLRDNNFEIDIIGNRKSIGDGTSESEKKRVNNMVVLFRFIYFNRFDIFIDDKSVSWTLENFSIDVKYCCSMSSLFTKLSILWIDIESNRVSGISYLTEKKL